ncbi:unnamed protein product [Dovyalis caffra]|uniref:Uncharacterized protein n=1 Tax=Dovyalis caffra TaxID=77055 RepID=A0AAV1RST2_9ROSI|nr:unnamed protein product [Dovyalis caffra]
MAPIKAVSSHVLIVISCVVVLLFTHVSASNGNKLKDLKVCGFDAIYNFGDSLSDTGNFVAEHPNRKPRKLVALDSIVNSAGFSSIKAYLDANQTDSNNGVNFAYSGATALSLDVLGPTLNASSSIVKNTLNTQLQWLDKYLKGFCQQPEDCKDKLKSSLFIMGEIGANDYSLAFMMSKKTIKELNKMNFASTVTKTIEKAIEKVIDYGAARVLVPGIYQVGCAPGYAFGFKNSSKLDKFGCANEVNDFFKHHNDLLQATLENLRKKYPGVSIVYGDYYSAMQFVLDKLQKFGFEYVTKACEPFTYPAKGTPCSDPEKYIFRDVFHSTESSNKYMANWLIQDIISKFGCK